MNATPDPTPTPNPTPADPNAAAAAEPTPSVENERMLTMSSGGWALVVGIAIGLTIVAWRVSVAVFDPSSQLRGDGRRIESYGFDLAKTTVPKDSLVPAKMAKDYVRALKYPRHVDGDQVGAINRAQRGKFLVSTDQVIGVVVNGEARAYPVRFMIWHEIANDVLGGKRIAVTYNFLTDSVMAFNREVGKESLIFGVSGIVHNSNLVMFDRRPNHEGESLWSQMGGGAIAGPKAGTKLEEIPTRLLPWGVWLREYPKSTVMQPPAELAMKKLYKVAPKPLYRNHDRLLFPASPLPEPVDGLQKKDRVVAVTVDDKTVVYPLVWLMKRVGDRGGELKIEQAGLPLTFRYDRRSHTADVVAPDTDRSVRVHAALWFAWHAFHPNDPLWDPTDA